MINKLFDCGLSDLERKNGSRCRSFDCIGCNKKKAKEQFKPIHGEKYYYISLPRLVVAVDKYNSYDYSEQVFMRGAVKKKIIFKTMKEARGILRKIKGVLNE